MGCPRCSGLERVSLVDGRWQCTTMIVSGVVPPSLVPGFAPAGLPQYGPCNRVFSPADERAADAGRAEEAARQAAEAAEQVREAAEAEARHQEAIAANEQWHGPAEPIRERMAAIDSRLGWEDRWPEGEDWALAGLIVGLAGTYLLAARRDPSPVGGPPDWLPSVFLTMPGWALVVATAVALGGALAWAGAFLRRASYPDPGLSGLVVLGVIASSFAVYLDAVEEAPGWVPSFLVLSRRWTAVVISASAAAVIACALVYARYYSNQHTLRRLQAERDELRTWLGCGNPACASCMSGNASLQLGLNSERLGDLP